MRFSKLSTEIQYDIFSNFTAEELCTRVAPVCRRWRKFAYEATLWKVVQLAAYKQSYFQMSQILKRAFRIRQLVLFEVTDFSWLKDLPVCESLQQIQFAMCVISNDTMSQLLQKYPHVQCCQYFSNPDYFDSRIKQIVRWKYLTSISLPGGINSTLTFIAENCVNLTKLDMSLHNETEEAFNNFLKLRGHQMQRLILMDLQHLSSKAYESLLQCQHLFQLILHDAKNFSDLNFVRLSELKTLKYVFLSNSELLFRTNSFTLYASVHFPPMEYMVFAQRLNCDFSPATVKSFLECCPFRSLTFLLSNAGLEQQCLSVVKECKNFDIDDNPRRIRLIRRTKKEP